MKRKSLLFLLLMAMFAPLAMNGQQTLPVADQGGTTSDSHVPFEGLYADDNYQHTQTIYPSSMLTAMQGGTITKLTYYLKTAITTNLTSTFEVRLGTTTSTSFNSGTVNYISMTGSANYTGTIDVTNSSKEVTITLATPYTYSSGNLVVDVRLVNHTTGYKTTDFLGETGSTYYSVYSKTSSSQPPFTQGSAASFMPKTTFTYTSTTPYISLTPATATVLTSSTQILTATYGNVSGTPTITYSSSNTNVATVTGSGTTATVTGVAPGTATITATMNGSYTATCTITVENPSYCTPSYSQTSDYIKSFVTTGGTTNISNTNTGQGTGGYSDFYNSHSASIEIGETLSFTVTRGYDDSYKYAIWVDWNHDYVFDVTTETVAQQTTSVKSDWSSSFTIPANTAAGDYRMRVEMLYGSSATLNPCVSASYGEVEDYKLTVLAASNCPTPTITNIAVTDHEAVISTDSDAENFNVQYRVVSEPATSTTYDFEDGTSQGWTTYDNDGDGYSWVVSNQLGSSSGGQTYVDSHGGDYYIVSFYNDEAYAENWLISPQFKLGGSISFYVKRLRNSNYDDYYRVYVSTTGTNISDFSEITTSAIEPEFEYELKTFDLSSYSGQGYVAIKHFANAYDQAYIFLDDITIVEGEDQNPWQTTNDLTLTGLSSGTTYEVQVQANCGATDGLSGWSSSATFTTIDNCVVPTGLSAELTGNSAELSWTGIQENYNVRYRKGFIYDFESATPWVEDNFSPCTTYDGDGLTTYQITDWTPLGEYQFVGSMMAFQNGVTSFGIPHEGEMFGGFVDGIPSDGNGNNDFFITPSITIENGDVFEFWAMSLLNNWGLERMKVGVYGGNGTISHYFEGSASTYVEVPNEWTKYSYDLSSYAGQSIQLAINCVSNDAYILAIDDVFVGNPNWSNPISVTGTTYNLGNLAQQSNYIWQVQGVNCDGNGNPTDWSASASFTTGEFYTKHIVGYGTGNDNWYLIASPIGEVSPTNVERLINTAGYDLYRFNQAPAASTETVYLEWENYKGDANLSFAGGFSLESGKGYLYANSETVDLVFAGTAYSGNGQVSLSYSTDNPDKNMYGWNLVGNPFAVNATITLPCYTMENDNKLSENVAGTTIAPMQGVLVHIGENDPTTLTFSTSGGSKSANLAMSLSHGHGILDRAIVTFDESKPLPKFQLRDGSTKVYIPMDGQDYAVVSAQGQGEMPVSFKAEENGRYTLSFNAEEIEFGYLHLIDNMTGNDVDLLANPSYSFDAKTTDYASRFKLVFVCGDANGDNDTFAFFSNGGFVINNDGNATLQVIDINGRIIKSESINGCANVNVNAASGVYMLRLVNGDIVKTQKVVVK